MEALTLDQQKLVEDHYWLAEKVADRRYPELCSWSWMTREEKLSEAYLGLVKAAIRYRSDHRVSFTVFADAIMRHHLHRGAKVRIQQLYSRVSGSAPLSERIVDVRSLSDSLIAAEELDHAQQALVWLSMVCPRLFYVLCCYYGLFGEHYRTMEDVAKNLRITRSRVQQLHKKAIARMRNFCRCVSADEVIDRCKHLKRKRDK